MKNYFFLLLAGLTLGACGNKAAQKAAAATTASTTERTFAMIKPDAVKASHTGAIISRIEAEGFKIVGLKKVQFSLDKAQRFYAVHKDRPFYADLTTFMSSAPTVVMVLEKDNAIKAWRELMGATNPANAEENTLRKLFAQSVTENAVHGSDAPETAAEEIAFFFAQDELV